MTPADTNADAPPMAGVPMLAELPATTMKAAETNAMMRDMLAIVHVARGADGETPYGDLAVRRDAEGRVVRDANGPLLIEDAFAKDPSRKGRATRRLRAGTTLVRRTCGSTMTVRTVVTDDASRACGYAVKLCIALHRKDLTVVDVEVECGPEAAATRPSRADAIHVAHRILTACALTLPLRKEEGGDMDAPYRPPHMRGFSRLLADVARIVVGAPASSLGWPEAHLVATARMDRHGEEPGDDRGHAVRDGGADRAVRVVSFQHPGGLAGSGDASSWELDAETARILEGEIPTGWRIGSARESFYDVRPFEFEAPIPRHPIDGVEALRIAQALGWDHAPSVDRKPATDTGNTR